jgi:hypothetical protein
VTEARMSAHVSEAIALRSLRENGLSDELLTAHMCHTMDRNYTRCRVMPRRWHKAAGDVWEESCHCRAD